jgi:hypothetical protein
MTCRELIPRNHSPGPPMVAGGRPFFSPYAGRVNSASTQLHQCAQTKAPVSWPRGHRVTWSRGGTDGHGGAHLDSTTVRLIPKAGFMDCGGQRSATPLWVWPWPSAQRKRRRAALAAAVQRRCARRILARWYGQDTPGTDGTEMLRRIRLNYPPPWFIIVQPAQQTSRQALV